MWRLEEEMQRLGRHSPIFYFFLPTLTHDILNQLRNKVSSLEGMKKGAQVPNAALTESWWNPPLIFLVLDEGPTPGPSARPQMEPALLIWKFTDFKYGWHCCLIPFLLFSVRHCRILTCLCMMSSVSQRNYHPEPSQGVYNHRLWLLSGFDLL